jgi:hypothetical protein
MTHEHQPPAPTAQPDDQSPEAETEPVPGAVTGNTAEPLPDSERNEEHEQQQDIAPPRIWVGSLSDYNNGVLHVEAYAEQLIDELGYEELLDQVVPPSLRPYVKFNIAGYAQDMWLSGEVQVYHRSGGGVWIFNGN